MITKLRRLLRNNYIVNEVKKTIIYLRFWQNKRKPLTTVFTNIYKLNEWKSGESVSGTGSILNHTEVIRNTLPGLIKEFNIKIFLDAPCGDFNWMKLVDLRVEKYIGADIVDEIIIKNNHEYSNQIRRFLKMDLTKDALPEADLLFCRDCLVHLSYEDIQKVMINLKSSSIKYFMTTTFTGRKININIPTGSWRPINLQRKPFSFPAPLKLINEKYLEKGELFSDKCLALWHVDSINEIIS